MDRHEVLADIRGGLGVRLEDIAVAKLVMLPFVLTLVVLVGWMLPLPAWLAVALLVLVLVPATLWNAGWRARTGADAPLP